MLPTAPAHIALAGIIGKPINYPWSNALGLHYYAAKDLNIRLFRAMERIGFRAKMALSVAVTEWIVWRLDGLADLDDAHARIDAAWAGVIDPLYCQDLALKMTCDHNIALVEGPLEVALCLLGETYGRYLAGSVYLAGRIVNTVMLGRHLMPDHKPFDDWLAATLRRAAKAFPPQDTDEVDEDDDDQEAGRCVDASQEAAVPREFFDPAFADEASAREKALQSSVKRLNPASNRYLRNAQQMQALGFVGQPYRR